MLAIALLLIATIAGLGEFERNVGSAVRGAVSGTDYHSANQWKLAKALLAHGLKEGDPVALVNGYVYRDRYHWAYVDHLHIVAEFGALPWRIAPRERTKFDHDPSEPADQDYAQLFWVGLTPEQRSAVIEAFRSTGARAIVSLSNPLPVPQPGWTPLGDTGASIYDLR
jgi:hypothetical protein